MKEFSISGEGSEISTNQKLENSAFSNLASDWLKFETLYWKYRTLHSYKL